MTYDEERAFARQQQNNLHGTGPTLDSKGYTMGVSGTLAAAQAHTTGYISAVRGETYDTNTSDAEMMIRDMDALVTTVRSLNQYAHAKLEQFSGPIPVSDSTAKHPGYKSRSSYFQILEARLEMLQGHVADLMLLIDSVSANAQTGIGAAQGSGITLSGNKY